MSKFVARFGASHRGETNEASAGYELWRSLNNELSVRSRVEGQALREQALGLVPPKHLKRLLDVARWYTTELLKFEAQVKQLPRVAHPRTRGSPVPDEALGF